MNSKQLKASHKEVYEQFFQKNPIVVSAPFLMTWAGDPSKYYSGITIKQKIPLRLYLGVTPTNTGKIQFNDIYYFDKISNQFTTSKILEYAPHFHQLNEHINDRRKEILEQYEGIDINILSELPRGLSLGFESIVSFLLATTFHRLLKHIDQKSLEDIQKLPLETVLKDSPSSISNRLSDGIAFDKRMFGTIISGIKRSSFFDAHHPIVTMAKDYDNIHEDVSFSLNKSYSFRFNELFTQLKPIPSLPLDYGIIYSGKPILLEQTISDLKKELSHTSKIKPDLKKVFSKYFNTENDNIPKFYKKFVDTDHDQKEKTLYGDIMGLISVEIFYFMAKLYETEYCEENIKSFLDALNKFRWGDYITKGSSGVLLDFIENLIENFPTNNASLAIFPNDTYVMGGTIGFALPLEGYRKHILHCVQETQKRFVGADLIYCSRMDGQEHKGIQFEQDIEKGFFSEFVDSQKHTLKTINGDNIIGDYNSLITSHDHDILLDRTSNKLYVKGKKVTSEQLHSQTTTIEVLHILFENIGRDVHSKSLPPSSYSKNKNEMLGKIVIPLLKLTKKKLNKEFPLICKGMLYDFYMKLGMSDIKIGIVDKVHNF